MNTWWHLVSMAPSERGTGDVSPFERPEPRQFRKVPFTSLLVPFLGVLVAGCIHFFDLRSTRDLDLLAWKLRHLNERHLWPVAGPRLASLASTIQASASDQASWGTYRPGYYFGMRQPIPGSTVMGLMWTHPEDNDALTAIRHEARQEHGLEKWGWEVHDGSSYGRQTVWDRDLALEIQWASLGETDGEGEWTLRIAASSLNATRRSEASLFFYFGEEDIGRHLDVDISREDACAVGSSGARGAGKTSGAWCASMRTSSPKRGGVALDKHFLGVQTTEFHGLADVVAQGLRYSLAQQQARGAPGGYRLELPDLSQENANVGIVQVSGDLPFSIEMTFRTGIASEAEWASANLAALFEAREAAFDAKFNATFPHLVMDNAEALQQQYRVSKYALSNMLGGIGYWYGSSLVDVDNDGTQVELWKAPLLSAVPSRSFFPRGFLWDEGFHHILIRRWDPAKSRAILAHWLDLMTASGWIPREQILGQEARSRVPEEFIAQYTSAANPPTLFLVLSDMAVDGSEEDIEFLKSAWPRLDRWFRWYNTTQSGPLPGSYRWRGRDATSSDELNPKTLTSGLDDYPRASHPSEDERHVDLRCWMAIAARTMSRVESRLSAFSGSSAKSPTEYAELADRLENYETLKSLHWDPERRAFADYGLNSPDAVLRDGRRVIDTNGSLPELGFVSQHLGYVTMFPLALRLIPEEAPELPDVLDILASPEHMWSPHGLRSLASSSPIYNAWNTKHDPPYWRGAIWVNMNYLILDALRTKYAGHPRALEAARALRENLVSTIGGQYDARGFVFENYDDQTGEGRGCFPFTGWSALVGLM